MRLRALRLYNVRCFAGRGIAIENIADGVNVLCAANESGKSTSFEALHALFFYPHSSTRKEVQRLRPYSGGNPLIEADIITPQGQFRLTKQFYGKNFAQIQDLQRQKLLAQADEAENFIADLMQTGVGSPAGLLWVRQGVNTLEKQNGTQEIHATQVRMGLLQSVQGEVDRITGGRRMDKIIDKVHAELDELVTKRGAKIGGRYHQALEAVEQLTLEEQELSIKVSALRQALDERLKLQRRLAEYDDPREKAARQREIEAAGEEFNHANLHHEKCKTAAALLELAQQNHETARKELENFHQSQTRHRQLQQQIQDKEAKRDSLVALRRGQTESFEQALEANAQLERQMRDMKQQLARCEMIENYDTIKQQCAKAEEIFDSLQRHQAARACIKITPEIYQELQEMNIEIARLQARATVARPSFKVHYAQTAKTAIKFGKEEIIEAQEHVYSGAVQLEIPDVGTLTLQANLDSHAERDLAQAQRNYRQVLDHYHLKDLTSTHQKLTQAQELDNQLAQWRLALEQCAPQGLVYLQTQLSQLEAEIEERVGTADAEACNPAQLREEITHIENRKQTITSTLQASHKQLADYEQEFIANEERLATLRGELAQCQTITGSQQEWEKRQRTLNQQEVLQAASLKTSLQQLEILRENAPDFEATKARLQRLQSAARTVDEEMSHLRESLAALNATIETHANQAVEENWFEVSDALTRARHRLEAEEKQLAVLKRLEAALQAARTRARDLYLHPIMSELTPLLKLVFDDLSLHFDDKTLLPTRISRHGQEENVEHLSGGMREQISILTRLAFARLKAHSGQEVPVILDDALIYCDDERIEKMFDVLHTQSHQQQIIVFSCRSRAFQRLGGTLLQMQDWQPVF